MSEPLHQSLPFLDTRKRTLNDKDSYILSSGNSNAVSSSSNVGNQDTSLSCNCSVGDSLKKYKNLDVNGDEIELICNSSLLSDIEYPDSTDKNIEFRFSDISLEDLSPNISSRHSEENDDPPTMRSARSSFGEADVRVRDLPVLPEYRKSSTNYSQRRGSFDNRSFSTRNIEHIEPSELESQRRGSLGLYSMPAFTSREKEILAHVWESLTVQNPNLGDFMKNVSLFIDSNRDGYIQESELITCIRKNSPANFNIDEFEICSIFQKMDIDKEGTIPAEVFIGSLR